MRVFALAAVSAILPALAHAQPADPAADPAAPAPRAVYRPVFGGAPQGVESSREDWKKANAEVARFPRGHADILKWEDAQAARRGPLPPMPAPATPAAPSGKEQR